MTLPMRGQMTWLFGDYTDQNSDLGQWNVTPVAVDGNAPVIVNNPAPSAGMPLRVLQCESTAAGGKSEFGAAFRNILTGNTYGGSPDPLAEVNVVHRFYVPQPDDVDGSGDLAGSDLIPVFRLYGSSINQARISVVLFSAGSAGKDSRLRITHTGASGNNTIGPLAFDTWHTIQIKFRHASAGAGSGVLQVWFNGSQVLNLTHSSTERIVKCAALGNNTGMTGSTKVLHAYTVWTDSLTVDPVFDRFLGAIRLGDASHDTLAVHVQQPIGMYGDPTITGWDELHAKVQWWYDSPLVPPDPTENETLTVPLSEHVAWKNNAPLHLENLDWERPLYYRVIFQNHEDTPTDSDTTPVFGPVRLPPPPGVKRKLTIGSFLCGDCRPALRVWAALKMFYDITLDPVEHPHVLAFWNGDFGYSDEREHAGPFDGSPGALVQHWRLPALQPLIQDFLRTIPCYHSESDHCFVYNNLYGANAKADNNPTAAPFEYTDGVGGSTLTVAQFWSNSRLAKAACLSNHYLGRLLPDGTSDARTLVFGDTRVIWTDTRDERDSRNGTETMMGTAVRDAIKGVIDAMTEPKLIFNTDPPMFDIGTDIDNWDSSTTPHAPQAWADERDGFLLDPAQANANVQDIHVLSGDRHCFTLHDRPRYPVEDGWAGWSKFRWEFWAGPVRRAWILQTIIDAAPTEHVYVADYDFVAAQTSASVFGMVEFDQVVRSSRFRIWDARYQPDFAALAYEPLTFDDTAAGYPGRLLFDGTLSGDGGIRFRDRSRTR